MMLATAMANRNIADQRADQAAEALERIEAILKRRRGDGDGDGQRDDDRRVAEREKQSDPDRTPVFLHEFAGHVVDRRDMIGVKRMPEAETIDERGGAEQNGIVVEGGDRPQPCGGVEDQQKNVDRDNFAPDIPTAVVEEVGYSNDHSGGSPLSACRLLELWRHANGLDGAVSLVLRRAVGGLSLRPPLILSQRDWSNMAQTIG